MLLHFGGETSLLKLPNWFQVKKWRVFGLKSIFLLDVFFSFCASRQGKKKPLMTPKSCSKKAQFAPVANVMLSHSRWSKHCRWPPWGALDSLDPERCELHVECTNITCKSWAQTDGCFRKWCYPQIIHFNRVFHDFHHPFWGTPIFGNTQIHSNFCWIVVLFYHIFPEFQGGFMSTLNNIWVTWAYPSSSHVFELTS